MSGRKYCSIKRGMLLVAVACLLANCSTSAAEETPVQTNAGSTAGAQESRPAPVLKGEVNKINVALENLEEVALDIKRLREAAGDLYDEVTIKPANFSMAPNVVGATVISLPVHISTAAMALPRPKWVNQCMSDIEPVIRLLKQDVDDILSGEKEIHLPQPVWDSLQPQFKDWVALVSNLDNQLNNLQKYTKQPPYDNNVIGTYAGQIQADARKLEITRKKIYKSLQKEARMAKKKERA